MTYSQFMLVKSLCRLARKTTNDSIKAFLKTKLLVSQVADEDSFKKQCTISKDQFESNAQDTFGRTIDLTATLKQGDLLVSGLGTNFVYQWVSNYAGFGSSAVFFFDENNLFCTCYTHPTCIQAVYMYSSDGIKIAVSGWRSGCYVEDALFSSTLECYFNASCLDLLRQVYTVPLNVQHLDIHHSSQSPPNTLVGDIIRRLMVDEWQSVDNFTAYYLACAPSTCSYTINEKREFVVIVGTLVGIWGGLTKVLALIVPRTVHSFRTYGRQWFGLLLNALRSNRVHALH